MFLKCQSFIRTQHRHLLNSKSTWTVRHVQKEYAANTRPQYSKSQKKRGTTLLHKIMCPKDPAA